MGSMSIWHWMLVIVVIMLLFGRGKISDLMGDVAQGIKSFKKGMADDEPEEKPKTLEQQASEKHEKEAEKAKS